MGGDDAGMHIMTLLPTTDRFRTDVILDEIQECPRCGCMTMFYRNVKGETYCYQCVPMEDKEEAC